MYNDKIIFIKLKLKVVQFILVTMHQSELKKIKEKGDVQECKNY